MQKKFILKCLTIIIILLFFGIAFNPSINANKSGFKNEDHLYLNEKDSETIICRYFLKDGIVEIKKENRSKTGL